MWNFNLFKYFLLEKSIKLSNHHFFPFKVSSLDTDTFPYVLQFVTEEKLDSAIANGT